MNAERFDSLLRALSGKPSRRGLMRVLAGSILAGRIGLDARQTRAKKGGAGKGKGKGQPKVTICHRGKTIAVARSAVRAHLKHGDTRGACTPSCPDGRRVCGNGLCCSPDRVCSGNAGTGFLCSCPAGTAACASDFCASQLCPGDVARDIAQCACNGVCDDARPLCGGTCCPPAQFCLPGNVCGCAPGTIECQPGFCASATCPNGQSRDPATCVCLE